jgi:hypothetical protein
MTVMGMLLSDNKAFTMWVPSEPVPCVNPYVRSRSISRRGGRGAQNTLTPTIATRLNIAPVMLSTVGRFSMADLMWSRSAKYTETERRRLEKLEETASQIRALNNGGKTKVLAVPTDVTKDADVANLFAQTVKTFGRSPDVVLSNAGAVEVGPMGEQGVDVWWGILVCCLHD